MRFDVAVVTYALHVLDGVSQLIACGTAIPMMRLHRGLSANGGASRCCTILVSRQGITPAAVFRIHERFPKLIDARFVASYHGNSKWACMGGNELYYVPIFHVSAIGVTVET